ncbi:hypothetical protein ACT7DB_01040 [Bacillus cereus]
MIADRSKTRPNRSMGRKCNGRRKIRKVKLQKQNQIAEKQLSNTIKQTAEKFETSQASRATTDQSETAKAAQKLQDLKGKEEQLQASTAKMNAQYELRRRSLCKNATKLKTTIENRSFGKSTYDCGREKVRNYQQQFDQAKRVWGENSNEGVTK